MRLTDFSLQKMAQSKYQGEIYFSGAEEAGEVLSRKYPFSKILLLLGVTTADKFALMQKLFPSANIVVLLPKDGVESLFALSDDISLAVAYGEDYVVNAARYFAAVRILPCAVFAYDACGEALACERVRITVGGEEGSYPAKLPEFLFVDETLLDKSSLLTAYVNVLSCKVALFELKFNGLILQTKYDNESYEMVSLAVSACMVVPFPLLEKRKIFCAALISCLCGAQGFPLGEVKVLQNTYRRLGAGALSGFYTMEKLSKVYHVFFTHGKYRKYYTPPYHARVRQASSLYKKREEEISQNQILPAVETLSLYAQVFESVRAQFLCEAQELLRRVEWVEDNIKEYKSAYPMENRLLNAALKYLPEGNKNYGVTSLMRDFGLLDF